jgi:osmotically-inducible protein OsmY
MLFSDLRIKFMAICCAFVLLQGCNPAFTAGSITASVMNSDGRSIGVMYDDQEIDAKILTKLADDSQLQNRSSISSTTYNHKVLLVGETTSYALKARARNLVRSIPKVSYVHNYIRVVNPLPSSTYAEDSVTTSKVKSAFLAKKGLKSLAIKVVTENKTVYLLGLVLPSQSSLATETARKVEGVRSVVNLLEYLK